MWFCAIDRFDVLIKNLKTKSKITYTLRKEEKIEKKKLPCPLAMFHSSDDWDLLKNTDIHK